MIPTTAAKLSCQPTSPPNRGLISNVATAASSGGQAATRRPARARVARIAAAPITPARWIEGPAPAIGT